MAKSGFERLGFANPLGKFSMFVEEPGVYKLEISHPKFYFEPVIVDVADSETSAFLYTLNTASKGTRLIYPLELEPSHKIKYFEQEEPFNPLVYLKSPMVLMVGFSLMMMWCMKQVPKEEMEAYQAQQSDTMKQC